MLDTVLVRLVPGRVWAGSLTHARLPPADGFLPHGEYLPFLHIRGNADVIPLDYALFRENPGAVDAGNGLKYFNPFDAQLDAVFAVMSAMKYDDIEIAMSETGWPSMEDISEVGATRANAAAYNGNLVKRVLTGGGTPLRPKADLRVFLFALFNENEKVGPTSEKNYGQFFPTEEKVYDIPLTLEGLKSYQPAAVGEVSKSVTGATW